ncbi:MAG: murein biosynthesis integral membrane protein MurJ [Anaerolineae bacterium]|nr:murein biosynthesis integral membrane protein MurJ [Anaerolineae bacterium]
MTDTDTQAVEALSGGRMARAALVVMLAYVASAALGLVRQSLVGSTFGASSDLDAFFAATRIPELLFNLIAGGALGSAFIPVFTGFLARGERDAAWQLASAVLTLWTAAAALLAAAMFVLAPEVVRAVLLPGDTPAKQRLAAELLRIMLSTVVIFSISGLLMAILNARQHFWRPAFALSLYNLGIIGGVVFLAGPLGIHGVAWGTVIGALLHAGIQVPGLRRVDARLRFSLNVRTPGVLRVLGLMLPRIIGQAVVQINFLVITAFTSFMVDGAQVSVGTAFTLMFTVLGILGQSIGTAAFPSLAALVSTEDWDGLQRLLGGVLRSVLFLAIPATVGLILIAEPLVRVLFERGRWLPEATAGTAWALQFFALGLAAHALLEILARSFYALQDTWTPVIVGVITMAINVLLDVLLIRVIGEPGSLARGPFAGLALAMSLATALEAATLWLLLRRRIGGIGGRRVWALTWRAALAAVGMGALVWGVLTLTGRLTPVIGLLLAAALGVSAYFGLGIILGLEEALMAPRLILQRLGWRGGHTGVG